MRGLLEEVDVRGLVVTLDAGHAGVATEAALADRHGTDYPQMIKGNCKAVLARLAARDWLRGRRYAQRWTRRLLTLQRGRRAVENANRYSRDAAFREDAGRIRTGNGPWRTRRRTTSCWRSCAAGARNSTRYRRSGSTSACDARTPWRRSCSRSEPPA